MSRPLLVLLALALGCATADPGDPLGLDREFQVESFESPCLVNAVAARSGELRVGGAPQWLVQAWVENASAVPVRAATFLLRGFDQDAQELVRHQGDLIVPLASGARTSAVWVTPLSPEQAGQVAYVTLVPTFVGYADGSSCG